MVTAAVSPTGSRRTDSLQRHMHMLRSVKSAAELALMRRAASAASKAFVEV
jgi:Xaa-Pro aminopeptidase